MTALVLGFIAVLIIIYTVITPTRRRVAALITKDSSAIPRISVELVMAVLAANMVFIFTGGLLLMFAETTDRPSDREILLGAILGAVLLVGCGLMARFSNKRVSEQLYSLCHGRKHEDEDLQLYSAAVAKWSWIFYLGLVPAVITLGAVLV